MQADGYNKFVKNKIIDKSRDKDPIRGRYRYLVLYDDDMYGLYYDTLDIVDKIDLIKRIELLDGKWKRIVFKLFINQSSP